MQNYFFHGLIPFHTLADYNKQCSADPGTPQCGDLFDAATKQIGFI